MNKASAIDIYAARLLMVSFFLPRQLQVWVVMAVSVWFVYRASREKIQIPRSNYTWALAISSIYVLYLFSIFITPEAFRAALFTIWGQKVSLLLMPFVFAVITPSFGVVIRKELMYFVYGCFLSCIIGNAGFAYKYLVAGSVHLSHVDYRITFETFTGLHPTYMGMYLCFSICILLLSAAFNNRLIIKYLLVCMLLVFLLSLLAKSPVIALVIIFIHYGYLNRSSLLKHKALLAGSLVVIAAACFFIPFISQRIGELLQFETGKSGSIADNSIYVRKLIWNTDTGLLKHYWLTGIGPGRLMHALREQYFFYYLASTFPPNYFDPHNEYFFEWLSFGILGIVLFVSVLTVHLARAVRAKDNLYAYLLIILCVTFFTESVLARQQGVLFYSIFMSLFFFLALQAYKGESVPS